MSRTASTLTVRDVDTGEQLASCRGRFGGVCEMPLEDQGMTAVFAWDIAGEARSTSASGRLAVQVAATDAAGSPVLACDAGTLDWTARSG